MAASTEQVMRGMFAQIVAGALIDAAGGPATTDAARRERVAHLLEIAVDAYDEHEDHATAETLRSYAYAVQHAGPQTEEEHLLCGEAVPTWPAPTGDAGAPR